MKSTFTNFLRRQRRREDAVGDFARDWIKDKGAGRPRGAYNLAAVGRYLERRNACAEAHDAARTAWREWRLSSLGSPLGTPLGVIKHTPRPSPLVHGGQGGLGKNDALSRGQAGLG